MIAACPRLLSALRRALRVGTCKARPSPPPGHRRIDLASKAPPFLEDESVLEVRLILLRFHDGRFFLDLYDGGF